MFHNFSKQDIDTFYGIILKAYKSTTARSTKYTYKMDLFL